MIRSPSSSRQRQPHQDPEYGFMRARSRLLQDQSRSEYADEISRLRSEIEDRTALNVAANWYGIAYGQMLLKRYDDAAAALANARATFVSGAPARDGEPLQGRAARRERVGWT
ncbi:putative Zn-dependent protease [Paraburkholderia sp. Kb1A]|nr:putative Zn-dependent protease [Paraburkholderia sp. Kb1A]